MATLLENAILVDWHPPRVQRASLLIQDSQIAARHVDVPRGTFTKPDETLDCNGCLVFPGLVNGHTHLYSALATGMPPPPRIPTNFHEILQFVWWRLDRALDIGSIELSARVGALDALRCGTTTLIDHHASPNAIEGSLDLIERGIASVGLRGVLCYETTDRNGRPGRDAGLVANRNYLDACRRINDGRFAALVGAHASFTLDDDSMSALAALADEFDTGVHIHVAEDPCDEAACRREHGISLIDRLDRFGLLRPSSILAHGTHLDDAAIARVAASGASIAHNPRSNMNNAVGYTPVGAMRRAGIPIQLGTDGIGSDMLSEARVAWLKSRDGQANVSPADILRMLAASSQRASAALGVTLGTLEPGAAADMVVTDYRPSTPVTSDNLIGHVLFALGPQHVRDVMIAGRWAMRDRRVLHVDEAASRDEAIEAASALWERMARLE